VAVQAVAQLVQERAPGWALALVLVAQVEAAQIPPNNPSPSHHCPMAMRSAEYIRYK
jgi:hypothetical protein